MAGIRGKNTKPEMAVRRGLHALGFRYRLHPRWLPGKPDLYLPKYKAAVFISGCFWHGHGCSLFKVPGSRTDFWLTKISQNRARDALVEQALISGGLRCLTIRECAIRGPGSIGLEATLTSAAAWLRGTDDRGEIRGIV